MPVAEVERSVVGWACLNQWLDRAAYNATAETRLLGYHTLIARRAEGRDARRHLNENAGFVRVGTLKEIGRKFGRWLDVDVMQLMLE